MSLEHHFNPPQGTFKPNLRLAWWKFKTLQDTVQEDYDHRIGIVRLVWKAFEQQVFQDQQAVEKKSLELWKRDPEAARSYLTDHCEKLAAQACRHADELVARLRGEQADGPASKRQRHRFSVSIERAAWKKWGFQYPVTYAFHLPDIPADARVWSRDSPSAQWELLEEKTPADSFNGTACVRFDRIARKAYVSVGFGAANTIQLEFANVPSVKFDVVAKYYDNRKAAYTLSNDNWGRRTSSHPGAAWKGMANDASDKYQAAVHACRTFHIPVTIAVNSRAVDRPAMWQRMQEELSREQFSWEPAVHTATHPCNRTKYLVSGYETEILGCRDDILAHLEEIPYGQHVFTFILPCGYEDADVEQTAGDAFLFLRAWNRHDNPSSTVYVPWNVGHGYFGIGGLQTVSYDSVFQSRHPAGRYYAKDVELLNRAFDTVVASGGIFYAMWHADRYENSVIHDTRDGIDGRQGSSLMQHLAHVANRRDLWYVANGWLYSYRYVAEHVQVDERKD